MLTEEQVLQKLASYKDAIIKIKNDRDKARVGYADLKEKSYHTIKHLVEDNIEVKEKEIGELKTQLNSSTNDIQNLKNSLEQKDTEFNNLHFKWQEASKNLYEKEMEITELKNKVQELETEKTKYTEGIPSEEFISKINGIIEEAEKALEE